MHMRGPLDSTLLFLLLKDEYLQIFKMVLLKITISKMVSIKML